MRNEARKSDRETLLALAVKNGDTPLVKLLCKHGANADRVLSNGRPLLELAAKHGSIESIRALHAFGADVNRPRDDGTAASGSTPLIAACRTGNLEAAKALLDLGANATTTITCRDTCRNNRDLPRQCLHRPRQQPQCQQCSLVPTLRGRRRVDRWSD